jgi:hypothetical protein
MFFELLPQSLCILNVARLGALTAAAEQNHNLPLVKTVIDAKAGSQREPQFVDTATDGLAITEISRSYAGQSGIHRRLHFSIAKGIKPLVKRDESVLKLQLLDFPLKHRHTL